ncbi:SapC family protein [Desulfobotulus mexicanus]|uniref:SapC family protein n=1 Tax=Desulfobotulus mexicanus TaxID=2586642 RepID=A0A5S5MBP3_9BACT|nr:SapC family protein [Desulfobotulus mexicanus]TYT73157.1 SapC family protein [Desulfobotulus mexicanus]
MQLLAVAPSMLNGKKWRRFNNYSFAAKDPVINIVGAEVGKASLAMPLAFIVSEFQYTLVAVLSPVNNENAFISPQGSWLGNYVPATFRSYPFRLYQAEDMKAPALCIEADSNLLVDQGDDTAADALEFFDENGKPAAELQKVIDFLTQIERNRIATQKVVDLVAQLDLLEPWDYQPLVDDTIQKVNGLYRINEKKLNDLSSAEFQHLRDEAALPIIYAQLISTNHITVFDHLFRLRKKVSSSQVKPLDIGQIEELFSDNDDTLKF